MSVDEMATERSPELKRANYRLLAIMIVITVIMLSISFIRFSWGGFPKDPEKVEEARQRQEAFMSKEEALQRQQGGSSRE